MVVLLSWFFFDRYLILLWRTRPNVFPVLPFSLVFAAICFLFFFCRSVLYSAYSCFFFLLSCFSLSFFGSFRVSVRRSSAACTNPMEAWAPRRTRWRRKPTLWNFSARSLTYVRERRYDFLTCISKYTGIGYYCRESVFHIFA